jgi:CheY-like chemotaxis protein
MKVIIVDDDPDDLQLWENAFRTVDPRIECICIESCERLLIYLSNIEPPDLLLMDMVMPKTDGLECVKELRQDSRFQNLKIVGQSTTITPIQRRLWEEHNVQVILKPNDYNELIVVLSELASDHASSVK